MPTKDYLLAGQISRKFYWLNSDEHSIYNHFEHITRTLDLTGAKAQEITHDYMKTRGNHNSKAQNSKVQDREKSDLFLTKYKKYLINLHNETISHTRKLYLSKIDKRNTLLGSQRGETVLRRLIGLSKKCYPISSKEKETEVLNLKIKETLKRGMPYLTKDSNPSSSRSKTHGSLLDELRACSWKWRTRGNACSVEDRMGCIF